MMVERKLTVVMTVYNRKAEYIRKAIEGILNQTFVDFEFYIINNGSTDPMCEKTILEYTDDRIIYVYIYQNAILSNNKYFFKQIFSFGKSKYIIWVHDDDIAMPQMLEEEYEILSNNSNIACVACNLKYIDEDGVEMMQPYTYENDIVYDKGMYVEDICMNRNVIGIPTPTMMFRREKILEAIDFFLDKDYEQTLAIDELWKFYINNKQEEIVVLKNQLYKYRLHAAQDSKKDLALDNYCLNEVYQYLCEIVPKELSDRYYYRVSNRCTRHQIAIELNKTLKNYQEIDGYINKQDEKIKQISRIVGCQRDAIEGALKKLYYIKDILGIKEYVLYGTGNGADIIKKIIDNVDDKLKCVGYIDSFKSGVHENGLPIFKADEYDYEKGTYIIVGATVAEGQIRSFLINEKGLKELKDFLPQFTHW